MSTQYQFAGHGSVAFPSCIEEAAFKWRAAGLLLPPVPRELAFKLSQLGEMAFGTEEREITDRDAWLSRAKDLQAPDSVLLGHVGHGVNSYYLCYQLIRGPLAVFLRQSFGGAYGDHDAEAAKFNAAVERLEELIVYADDALKAGRLKPGQRLLICVDEHGPSGWELSPAGTWRDNDNPIDLVMKSLGPK
jgi:hypothetical protein